jgi:uncharacterized protein YjdB
MHRELTSLKQCQYCCYRLKLNIITVSMNSKHSLFFSILFFLANSIFAQLPTVTAVNPMKGISGVTVATVTGTNFNTTPGNNIVFFGATRASITTAGSTSLVVTVPAGATYKGISITNTASALTGYSQYPFLPTYDNSPYIPGTINFSPKTDLAAGASPESVAIGDIDGDGKPDLVVVNSGSDNVSVYHNTSSSGSITGTSFATPQTFAAGNSPHSLAIGDIDGDGKPDMAVTNFLDNTISVYRNTSSIGSITSASFATQQTFATGSRPRSVAIADLDGDGKPELSVANSSSNTVSVFQNIGSSGNITSGSFATQQTFGTGSIPYCVAIGDIDGDGKPDMAVVNSGSWTVSVFRNTSTAGSIASGSFASQVTFATEAEPFYVAISDLDGDEKPDLAVANATSYTVSVLRNTSISGSITNSSFDAQVTFETGENPASLSIADMDGDGKPDLATSNMTEHTVSILRNTSSSGSITSSSFATQVKYETGPFPRCIVTGDLDSDGKPDIVTANSSGSSLSVLRNDPLQPIIGLTNVCVGTSTTYSNAAIGGSWSSSNGNASIGSATGIITGVTSGTATISYILSSGSFVTTVVSVNATATSDAITGALAICPGGTTDLNSTTVSGIWSSGNPAIATVNSTSGLVTSLAGVGTTTISYTVGATCPQLAIVTVTAVSANVGTPIICLGQPFSIAVLTNPISGGTWSSSNPSRVPINSVTGVLKGKSLGTVTISYHLGADCASTTELRVNPAIPVVIGPVAMCPGATEFYSNSTSGGTWSCSNVDVATVDPISGIVEGVFEGTTTVSYIVNEGCYNTKDITIYGSLTEIIGEEVICQGSTTILSSGPAGGTWSSGHTTASVNISTGLVTGLSAGTAMITYRNGSSGCYVTKEVTINSSVATISGTANICPGFTTSLSNADGGGTWSSSNTGVATVDGSGVVTGVSTGTAIITYTTSPGCYKTTIQTVKTAPSPIGGPTEVCQNATVTVYSGPSGSAWSSSNMAIATISSGGIIRGIAPGVTTIQYTLSTGCIATKDVSVNNPPDAITGVTSVCVNATTDLFSGPSGGTWASSNTVKSTIDATSGVVTGKSAGTSSITYMLPTGCYVKTAVTTKAPPAAIWGTTTISQGDAQILYCSPGGGAWSSADPGIASYNPAQGGRTYGVSAGTTTVTYTIPSTGCFSTTEVTVASARPGQEITVNGDQKKFNIYPNPNQGVLNVETSENGTFAVFTIDGRQVANYEITETATTLSLPNDLASGVYMCKFTGADGSTEMVRLVYER